MQHHTGQHLISAVAERAYGHSTRSWELGKDSVTIELEVPLAELPDGYLQDLEGLVNQEIRRAAPISWQVVGRDDLEAVVEANGGLRAHHKKGLPEGYSSRQRPLLISLTLTLNLTLNLTLKVSTQRE